MSKFKALNDILVIKTLFMLCIFAFLLLYLRALLLPYGFLIVKKTEQGYDCNYGFRYELSEVGIREEFLAKVNSPDAELIKNTPEFQDTYGQIISDDKITKCESMAIAALILELSNQKKMQQLRLEGESQPISYNN